jgi:integrase
MPSPARSAERRRIVRLRCVPAGAGDHTARSAARRRVVPAITPHDLRHAAESLAVSGGADVEAVQRMLRHAKASMTLDVYADLFDEIWTASQSAWMQLSKLLRTHCGRLPKPDRPNGP